MPVSQSPVGSSDEPKSNLPSVDNERSLKLSELERVIERGLNTFLEVGQALTVIRDDRLFVDAGYRNFGDYVRERWGISRPHAYLLMSAADTAASLSRARVKIDVTKLSQRSLGAIAPVVKADPDRGARLIQEIEADRRRVTEEAIKAGFKMLIDSEVEAVVAESHAAERAVDELEAAVKRLGKLADGLSPDGRRRVGRCAGRLRKLAGEG